MTCEIQGIFVSVTVDFSSESKEARIASSLIREHGMERGQSRVPGGNDKDRVGFPHDLADWNPGESESEVAAPSKAQNHRKGFSFLGFLIS